MYGALFPLMIQSLHVLHKRFCGSNLHVSFLTRCTIFEYFVTKLFWQCDLCNRKMFLWVSILLVNFGLSEVKLNHLNWWIHINVFSPFITAVRFPLNSYLYCERDVHVSKEKLIWRYPGSLPCIHLGRFTSTCYLMSSLFMVL